MRVSKKEFKNLTLTGNYILVRPDPGNDKVILKSGVVLFLDTSFQKEHHAVTCGTVIKIPKALTYFQDNGLFNLDYFTTQELKMGDRIIFHYLQASENIKQSRYIECDGEVFFLIHYDKIFCALRGDDVVPINGNVIVEAEKEKVEFSSGLIVPDIMRGRKSETIGTIRYIGTPLAGYNDYQNWGPDKDELKVGDRVLFRKVDSVPLQYHLHQSIDKEKTLYRMHRKDILGNYDEILASIQQYAA